MLGSMPGTISLRQGRYYAHPRNAFWPIAAEILGFDPALDYALRLERLTQAGVALWDVLQGCEREGSLTPTSATRCPTTSPASCARIRSCAVVA